MKKKSLFLLIMMLVFQLSFYNCSNDSTTNSDDNITQEDNNNDNNTSSEDNSSDEFTKYHSENPDEMWDIAQKLWKHFKNTFIVPNASRYKGDNWLVFDYYNTYANSNGAFTSEGVAYGMMLALYMDDKETFDNIWKDAEKYLGWNQGDYFFYSWIAYYDRDYEQVVVKQPGVPASDAEIDIAAALIMAYKRWGNTEIEVNSPLYGIQGKITYKDRAKSLIETIWNKFTNRDFDDWYINPGGMQQLTQSAGYDEDYWVVNPSYFILANLKLFKDFEEGEGLETHSWNTLIDGCINIMKKYPGYEKGLQPDWMDYEGEPILKDGNYVDNYKYDMYKDAIRVPWRIATYKLWYDDGKVDEYINNAVNYVWDHKEGLYYKYDGSYYLDYQDKPIFDGGGVAMWSTLFCVSDVSSDKKEFWVNALKDKLVDDGDGGYYVSGNRRYYENALATFAAILLSGRYKKLY